MTPEALMARVSGQSIALADPIGGARPQWTLVEMAWGCAHKLDERFYLAFRWRHGRDGGCYGRLREFLLHETEQLAWRDRWKRKINGVAQNLYLRELVNIVLNEELMSFVERQRLLTVLEKQWPEGVFDREIAPKQRRIAMLLDAWCAAAHEHVARRIRDDEFDIGAVVD